MEIAFHRFDYDGDPIFMVEGAMWLCWEQFDYVDAQNFFIRRYPLATRNSKMRDARLPPDVEATLRILYDALKLTREP